MPALQELVRGRLGRATEVLPALQYIFLEERQVSGPVEEGIQLAVAVRQAIGHYSSFIRTEGSVRLRPPTFGRIDVLCHLLTTLYFSLPSFLRNFLLYLIV